MAPGAPFYIGQDVVKYGWPDADVGQNLSKHDAACLRQPDVEADPEFEAELRRLRCDVASLRFDWELTKLSWKARKYSPNQPRVPAGNPDGGQWTSEGDGGGGGVRLAVADKVMLGGAAAAKLLFEAAKKAIDAYRSKELLWDLLGDQVGTVAHIEIDGEKIFGVNSGSPNNEIIDSEERQRLLQRYGELHPDEREAIEHRRKPYDAFYHAETSVLLRAARRFGGSLSGRELDVFVDRRICNNCEVVLPFVGSEIGNPTIRFFDRRGHVGTVRDGAFYKVER